MSPGDPHHRDDPDRQAAAVALDAANLTPDQRRFRLAQWAGADPARQAAAARAERAWTATAGLTAPAPRRLKPLLALAASLALILGLAAAPETRLRLTADEIAGPAGAPNRALGPGVTADLDAGAALDIARTGPSVEIRLLRGEAFFTVDPEAGLRVAVRAGDVLTRVTGTRFAVALGTGAVTVAVAEGSVAVTPQSGPTAPVTTGESLRVEGARTTRSAIDPADVAAWRTGRLVVADATLAEVAATLDRRFTGRILIADAALGARRVTGAFRLDDPLAALEAAAAPHHGRLRRVTPWLAILAE